MHSLLNSIGKRLYTARLSNARARRTWAPPYWEEQNGIHSIACRRCPKFVASRAACAVPFGSPLRKCVTAAQEAHLHSLDGLDLLEIGYGRHSIPRRLIAAAGGTWTGIDPLADDGPPRRGAACRGHAGAIPFPDASFDIVVGIQTLEHWGDPLPDGTAGPGYARGLAEVHRVLKPGGRIYFDAPIHLHGHEMFIAGDLDRITACFEPSLWSDLTVETWRREHDPLPRYATPAPDLGTWGAVTGYSAATLESLRANASVWLVALTARRNAAAAAA